MTALAGCRQPAVVGKVAACPGYLTDTDIHWLGVPALFLTLGLADVPVFKS